MTQELLSCNFYKTPKTPPCGFIHVRSDSGQQISVL